MEDVKTTSAPPEKRDGKKKLSMTTWILIALGAGIVCGIVSNMVIAPDSWANLYIIEGGSVTVDGCYTDTK